MAFSPETYAMLRKQVRAAETVALAAFPHAQPDAAASVTATDGADGVPLRALSVALSYSQAGEGYAAPNNIRAITGPDSVTLTQIGDPAITAQPEDYTGDVGDTATFTVTADGTDVTFQWQYQNDGEWTNILAGTSASYSIEITEERIGRIYRCAVTSSIGGTVLSAPVRIIETGTTPEPIVPDYTPYAPREITVALGRTVYGGTLDVLTGVLMLTWFGFVIDGSEDESWLKSTSSGYTRFICRFDGSLGYPSKDGNSTGEISSHFRRRPQSSQTTDGWGTFRLSADGYIVMPDNDDGMPSVSDLRTWLGEQSTAGTPVQIVYKIKTPLTYQLTPQQIETVLGKNTFSVDSGTVALDYRADPTLYIARQIAAAAEE